MSACPLGHGCDAVVIDMHARQSEARHQRVDIRDREAEDRRRLADLERRMHDVDGKGKIASAK